MKRLLLTLLVTGLVLVVLLMGVIAPARAKNELACLSRQRTHPYVLRRNSENHSIIDLNTGLGLSNQRYAEVWTVWASDRQSVISARSVYKSQESSEVWLFNLRTQRSIRVAQESSATSAQFAPDSKHVAVIGWQWLRIYDLEGIEVLHVDDIADSTVLGWSADGRYFAYPKRSEADAPINLYFWDSRGEFALSGIPMPDFGYPGFAWSPVGHQYAAIYDRELLIGEPNKGQPRSLTFPVSLTALRWLPTGRFLALTDTTSDLTYQNHIVDVSVEEFNLFTLPQGNPWRLQGWSSDSARIGFEALASDKHTYRNYVFHTDRWELEEITPEGARQIHFPSFEDVSIYMDTPNEPIRWYRPAPNSILLHRPTEAFKQWHFVTPSRWVVATQQLDVPIVNFFMYDAETNQRYPIADIPIEHTNESLIWSSNMRFVVLVMPDAGKILIYDSEQHRVIPTQPFDKVFFPPRIFDATNLTWAVVVDATLHIYNLSLETNQLKVLTRTPLTELPVQLYALAGPVAYDGLLARRRNVIQYPERKMTLLLADGTVYRLSQSHITVLEDRAEDTLLPSAQYEPSLIGWVKIDTNGVLWAYILNSSDDIRATKLANIYRYGGRFVLTHCSPNAIYSDTDFMVVYPFE